MKKISPNTATQMIRDSKGKIFTVTFVKRTNCEVRTMNCRTGVKKGIVGNARKRRNSGIMTVYDVQKREFRNVNLSGIRTLKMNRETYQVEV